VDAASVMVENGYRDISERPQPIHCPSEELTQLMRN